MLGMPNQSQSNFPPTTTHGHGRYDNMQGGMQGNNNNNMSSHTQNGGNARNLLLNHAASANAANPIDTRYYHQKVLQNFTDDGEWHYLENFQPSNHSNNHRKKERQQQKQQQIQQQQSGSGSNHIQQTQQQQQHGINNNKSESNESNENSNNDNNMLQGIHLPQQFAPPSPTSINRMLASSPLNVGSPDLNTILNYNSNPNQTNLLQIQQNINNNNNNQSNNNNNNNNNSINNAQNNSTKEG